MGVTKDNLSAAFAGESQANRKYLAFAKKAEEEGYAQVAKLFRAAAASETIHAHNHLKVLGGIGSTADNLKAAIEGESSEVESMYPKFIDEAKGEGDKDALMSFRGALEAEKIHARLYKEALDNLGKNKEVDYFVCEVCGYTVEGEAPEKCPVCGAGSEKFEKIS